MLATAVLAPQVLPRSGMSNALAELQGALLEAARTPAVGTPNGVGSDWTSPARGKAPADPGGPSGVPAWPRNGTSSSGAPRSSRHEASSAHDAINDMTIADEEDEHDYAFADLEDEDEGLSSIRKCTDCRTVPGVGYIGRGYNLLYGNPVPYGAGSDPGFLTFGGADIFKLTYRGNQRQGRVVAPDGVTIREEIGCTSSMQSRTASDFAAYQRMLAAVLEAGTQTTNYVRNEELAGPLWRNAFAASAEAAAARNALTEGAATTVTSTAQCAVYRVTMESYLLRPQFSADFVMAIANLMELKKAAVEAKEIDREGEYLPPRVKPSAAYLLGLEDAESACAPKSSVRQKSASCTALHALEEAWFDLFDYFGTHHIMWLTLGSAFHLAQRFSPEVWQQMTPNERLTEKTSSIAFRFAAAAAHRREMDQAGDESERFREAISTMVEADPYARREEGDPASAMAMLELGAGRPDGTRAKGGRGRRAKEGDDEAEADADEEAAAAVQPLHAHLDPRYARFPQYTTPQYTRIFGAAAGAREAREAAKCPLCELERAETEASNVVLVGAPPELDALKWQRTSRASAAPIGYQMRSLCHLIGPTTEDSDNPLELDETAARAFYQGGESSRFEVGDAALRRTCFRAQELDKYCDRRVGRRGKRGTCRRPLEELRVDAGQRGQGKVKDGVTEGDPGKTAVRRACASDADCPAQLSCRERQCSLAYTRVVQLGLAAGWRKMQGKSLQTPCATGFEPIQLLREDGSFEDVDLNNGAASMPTIRLCMYKGSSAKHISNTKPICQVATFATEHRDGTFAGVNPDTDPLLMVSKRPSWANPRGSAFAAQLSWVHGKERHADGTWTGAYKRNINDMCARGTCASEVDTTEIKDELPDTVIPSRFIMAEHGSCENYVVGSRPVTLTRHHTCNPYAWVGKRPDPMLGRAEVNDVEIAIDQPDAEGKWPKGAEIGDLPSDVSGVCTCAGVAPAVQFLCGHAPTSCKDFCEGEVIVPAITDMVAVAKRDGCPPGYQPVRALSAHITNDLNDYAASAAPLFLCTTNLVLDEGECGGDNDASECDYEGDPVERRRELLQHVEDVFMGRVTPGSGDDDLTPSPSPSPEAPGDVGPEPAPGGDEQPKVTAKDPDT